MAVVARDDVKLVDRAFADIGDKPFPNARLPILLQGMGLMIPAVEVADGVDALGIRRPHREIRSRRAVALHETGAEFVVQAIMRALIEQMQIVRPK